MPRNIGHLLIHSIDIQRSTPIDDGQGGSEEVFQSVGVVRGRVWPANHKDLMVAGQDQSRVTHAVIFKPGTDVRIDDQLVFDSRQFNVKVREITPSIPIYHKVLAEEIQIG
jgi:SPP1 family predicted phage head-tail adaptor